MKKLLLRSFIVSAVVLSACSKHNVAATPTTLAATATDTQLTGLLKRQGGSTYQYGTHILITSTSYYALKSTVADLNLYNDKTVTITGNRIAGYPVDGGPIYIDVQTIK